MGSIYKRKNPRWISWCGVLSSTLGYVTKQLYWIHENPCSRILKLKGSSCRDLVLSAGEIERLLEACKTLLDLFLIF